MSEPNVDVKQLGEPEVRQLRHVLHELANLFTGVLVSGGLLHQSLADDRRQRYSGEICSAGERGAELVRHARALLIIPNESIDSHECTCGSTEKREATESR